CIAAVVVPANAGIILAGTDNYSVLLHWLAKPAATCAGRGAGITGRQFTAGAGKTELDGQPRYGAFIGFGGGTGEPRKPAGKFPRCFIRHAVLVLPWWRAGGFNAPLGEYAGCHVGL